ncbi:hypothetical protein V9T40_007763 [Parthenolecanium corni]|uniref:Carboxypeptidase n=1 Tax=Parthenolecanium corni TaxID=536013 RepID=A0AAN9TM99_9HEMI
MYAKFAISFAICHLCTSVIINIRPIKIIKYAKSSTGHAFANTTTRYDDFGAHADYLNTTDDIKDYEDYVYNDRTESYDEFEGSADDENVYNDYYDTTTDTLESQDEDETSCEEEEENERCVEHAKRKRPIVTPGGATVLNPYDRDGSKNASSVVPLFGSTPNYSGYLSINERYGAFLFFWFFYSQTNPATAPLVIWLQGQPGTSVLVGLFEEHGPYHIDKNGTMHRREFTWNREFNVLYLDHCIPCGFSFARDDDGATTTLEASAEAVYQGLQQFFGVFTEFANNEVYLAGEYGCGKIIPIVCLTIQSRNQNAAVIPVNLKGAMIGSAMVDVNYMVNYGHYWYTWGLADPQIRQTLGFLEEIARGYIRADFEDDVLNYFRYHIFVKLSERDYNSPYDLRFVNASLDERVTTYIDERLFRQWLHVGNSTYHFGHKYLSIKLLRDISSYIPQVLQNFRLMFYSGQFDPLFTYNQASKFLQRISWSELDKWFRSSRQNWYINDRLVGYSKSHRTLTQVLVRNAGHMVGKTQPEALFYLLKWFVEDKFPHSVEFGLQSK